MSEENRSVAIGMNAVAGGEPMTLKELQAFAEKAARERDELERREKLWRVRAWRHVAVRAERIGRSPVFWLLLSVAGLITLLVASASGRQAERRRVWTELQRAHGPCELRSVQPFASLFERGYTTTWSCAGGMTATVLGTPDELSMTSALNNQERIQP